VANINAQTEKLTVQYQNNQSLSETQKNEKIEALKEAQKGYQQAFSGSRTKTVLSILLLWATSLVPLIFLTRERVKQEFN
jgi:3'-phosphoadenosine 5'-phosphosulfate sulfotransferase (PAPS reductase)/FAD synthetase